MSPPELSVVVPAYNEAENLSGFVRKLDQVLSPVVSSYEVVIVDDGSSDATEECLAELADKDPKICPVQLSRNFGKEAALAAGLSVASGECLIFIDADLQHPLEIIPQMLEKWRQGYDVVNGVKKQRATESRVYRWFAARFNETMTRLVGNDMAGASDYKLIDRQVAEVLLECPERNRFFRGLVSWVGFRVSNIEFDVQEREQGESKWSLLDLMRYSIRNVVSFSSFPLRLVAYIGFITILLGSLLLAQSLFKYMMGTAAVGFTTVIATQILLGGMVLFALGVIAIYLSHIYEEQKARPMFIIRRPRLNQQADNNEPL